MNPAAASSGPRFGSMPDRKRWQGGALRTVPHNRTAGLPPRFSPPLVLASLPT